MKEFNKILNLTFEEYNQYLTTLVELGLFENKKNKANKYSKSFKFISNFLINELTEFPINDSYTDQILLAFRIDFQNRSTQETKGLKAAFKLKQLNNTHCKKLTPFLNNKSHNIHHSLSLIEIYKKHLPEFSLKKFEYITDILGAEDTNRGIKYKSANLYDLFPNTTDDFLQAIAISQSYLIITNCINFLQSQTYKIADGYFFKESDKMRTVFLTDQGFKLFNDYLAEHGTRNPNKSFFNRLKYALHQGRLNDSEILDIRKKQLTIFREEISRVFSNIENFKFESKHDNAQDEVYNNLYRINSSYRSHNQ